MDFFDKIDKMMSEDNLVNEKALKKLKFDSIAQREKAFKKNKECIFPGCKNRSIKKSHAIQKSKSLKIISETSFLLRPLLNEKNSEIVEMVMEKVGIGDATTFPGFCEKHEALFSSFENSGEFTTLKEACLQAYRSICRELVFNINELENIKKEIVKYKNLRNTIALEEARKDLVNPKKIQKVSIEYEDNRLNLWRNLRVKLENKVSVLEKLHESLLNTINNKKSVKSSYLKALEINQVIPLALCGIGNVYISEDKGNKRNVFAVLNVIPLENSTFIILAGNIEDKDILEEYWRYYSQNFITVLNCIESFMINGTDHWFINPQCWNSMESSKKDYILYDLLATNKSFLQGVDYSIFDDIRIKFINRLEKQQTILYQQNIEKLILDEKSKLKFKFPTVNNNLKELFIGDLINNVNGNLFKLNE